MSIQKGISYVVLLGAQSLGYSYIGWNEAREFFKDRRVRLAMTYAVNRPAITRIYPKKIMAKL